MRLAWREQSGGAIYIHAGDVTLSGCVFSENIANGANSLSSGHALTFYTATYLVQIYDSTFAAGTFNYTTDGTFIDTKAVIDYGECAAGTSPGLNAATNILVLDGDFTGCPFRCEKGTYGVGGASSVLRSWSNFSGCSFGCHDCPAGAVCAQRALPAPEWCSAGHYNPDPSSASNTSCRPCERCALRPPAFAHMAHPPCLLILLAFAAQWQVPDRDRRDRLLRLRRGLLLRCQGQHGLRAMRGGRLLRRAGGRLALGVDAVRAGSLVGSRRPQPQLRLHRMQ